MCLCYVMKNKMMYPCKTPCEMYIRIFIAERLSVTEILLISFFKSFFFSFFVIFFFTCNDLLFSCHLCVSPSCLFVCFSFRSIYQHQLSCRNFKIIIHSCLETLGMYGVTWFPLKSYIRTKSKWVEKQTKKRIGYKSNQRREKAKGKCLCASWYWTGKKRLFILD